MATKTKPKKAKPVSMKDLGARKNPTGGLAARRRSE
jgi:hypothetical protein